MTLFRVLACFLALVLLSNCKEVDSTPVFDAGRLTSAELDALVGTYREEPANDATILTVQRADAETDLLRFEWGKERAPGQAVVSRVGTSDIFVALINMESHGFVASNAGNAIILLKRSTPDRLEVLIGDYLDPLYAGIEAFTDPQLEKAFILSYIENNAALLERQSGPVYAKVGDANTGSARSTMPEFLAGQGFALEVECLEPFTGWLSLESGIAVVASSMAFQTSETAGNDLNACAKNSSMLLRLSGFTQNIPFKFYSPNGDILLEEILGSGD